eukprot:656907-Alexandrium_andersonii.AAC.1
MEKTYAKGFRRAAGGLFSRTFPCFQHASALPSVLCGRIILETACSGQRLANGVLVACFWRLGTAPE